MESGYWRRAHRRAMTDTVATLGLESRARIVIGAAAVVAALLALAFYGSSDASRDETIVRLAIAGLFIGLFPFVYLWKLAKTPPLLEAEREATSAVAIDDLNHRMDRLAEQINASPHADLIVRKNGDVWCLEIHNSAADAKFTVKLDLSQTGVPRAPATPVEAKWADLMGEREREIQAGGWDRILLFQVEYRDWTMTNIFHWATDNYAPKHTTSWMPTNKGILKPTGEFTIFVSSKPPLRGGAKRLELAFNGGDLRLISGEAQLLQ